MKLKILSSVGLMAKEKKDSNSSQKVEDINVSELSFEMDDLVKSAKLNEKVTKEQEKVTQKNSDLKDVAAAQ